jgi:hypothetical protein
MESLSAITSTPPRANTREPVPEKNRREGCKRIPDGQILQSALGFGAGTGTMYLLLEESL